MKLLNKIIFFFLLMISSLRAESFYIKEPVLNSKMYLEIHGNKNNETVIFVHGLGDEASSIWKDSVEKLKENYQVIIFDLPGFGNSSKDGAEYTPEKYALILDYIVSNYVNKPFYLVGHSMGAAISLEYVTLFENKVKKLFLIDAAGILHKDAYEQFLIKKSIDKYVDPNYNVNINSKITNVVSKVTNGLSKIVPSGDLESKSIATKIKREFILQTSPTFISAIGLSEKIFSGVYKIKTPTLILWGEKDDIAPLRTGYVLNKLIVNSQLEIIKNSKHVPILDSKEKYLSYLDKFLNEEIENKKKYQKELTDENQQIVFENNITAECKAKNLKIIDSKNIQLYNCNLENLTIENSTVWLINSDITSDDVAITATKSNLNITSSDINGRVAMELNNSKLDIAAANLTASEISILSKGVNQVIFSLTTIRSPIANKTFHKKVTMQNNNKF